MNKHVQDPNNNTNFLDGLEHVVKYGVRITNANWPMCGCIGVCGRLKGALSIGIFRSAPQKLIVTDLVDFNSMWKIILKNMGNNNNSHSNALIVVKFAIKILYKSDWRPAIRFRER